MRSISTLFASEVLVKLLVLFLFNPETTYYQTEAHQKVGGSLRNAQKMLKKLVDTGLVRQFKRGHMSYYQANSDYPGFQDLKQLLLKTVAIGDLLREGLETLSDKVSFSFIFGSYARGQETGSSDIDLLLIGELSLKTLANVIGPITDTIGREINPVVYSEAAFLKEYKNKNRFIQELVSSEKVWLIGKADDFKQLVS